MTTPALPNDPAPPSETSTRRPYTGSCHCGLTKYIAYITLPPSQIPHTTRIRKCNCTTCHKMSFFHLRLPDPHSDFLLLSPITSSPTSTSPIPPTTSPSPTKDQSVEREGESAHGGIKIKEGGLKDYTCFEAKIHWYFCSRCGVRCFAFAGEGEIRSLVLPLPNSLPSSDRTPETTGKQEGKTAVWTPKEGFREGDGKSYLSINAATLDAEQEGLDLRAWHEKGWIEYLEILGERLEKRVGVPFEGGMY